MLQLGLFVFGVSLAVQGLLINRRRKKESNAFLVSALKEQRRIQEANGQVNKL